MLNIFYEINHHMYLFFYLNSYLILRKSDGFDRKFIYNEEVKKEARSLSLSERLSY